MVESLHFHSTPTHGILGPHNISWLETRRAIDGHPVRQLAHESPVPNKCHAHAGYHVVSKLPLAVDATDSDKARSKKSWDPKSGTLAAVDEESPRERREGRARMETTSVGRRPENGGMLPCRGCRTPLAIGKHDLGSDRCQSVRRSRGRHAGFNGASLSLLEDGAVLFS
jgi:hypothetical protein